ncbi:MAG: carboxypeptidase-like regulatory domain-containing protein [Acidimicrobiia bacterium]
MATLTSTDLRDPAPPVPGRAQRAAVAARADQLVRRRRYVQGASALGVVVTVAVAVAALSAGGTASSPGSQRIQAANSPSPAPTRQAPSPVTPAPGTLTWSGHASGVPESATLTVTLTGSGGTFTAIADGSGNFSISGIPTGEYTGSWEWVSTDGTATSAGKLGGVNLTADHDVTFSVRKRA